MHLRDHCAACGPQPNDVSFAAPLGRAVLVFLPGGCRPPATPRLPEDIWQAVRFILERDYFNGRTIDVDGGLCM